MKLNRKSILVLALVLSVAIATTGTLAYLTDRDSAANVFTMGNVSIKLNEKYTQNSELLPGKEIQKEVTVTNTGTTDAWVWMSLAMPKAFDDASDASKNHIHWNVPGVFWKGYQDNEYYKQTAFEAGYITSTELSIPVEKTWDVSNAKAYKTTIGDDGISYQVYDIWYYGVLPAGETTNIGLSDVYLDKHIDIDPEGNLYRVENGVVTPIEWNINTQGNPKIYVSAYAIQATGFDTAEEAYEAYHAQWGTEGKGTEWAKVVSITTETENPASALMDASEEGASYIDVQDGTNITIQATSVDDSEIDAKNATVIMSGDGETNETNGWLTFIAADKSIQMTVENLTVTGSGHVQTGEWIKGNSAFHKDDQYTVNNLVLENLLSTRASTQDSDKISGAFYNYGTTILNNCIMTGATTLYEDLGYIAYDAGFPNDSTTTINGGEYGKIYLWSKANVTISEATIDQIDSTAAKLSTYPSGVKGMLTIESGTHVKTINVKTVGLYDTPQLTIKEGATVDKIIYENTTYTSEKWPEWVQH